MKKILFLVLLMYCSYLQTYSQALAQQESMKVKTFTLSNGLTVYLNEDHTSPKVFGCVVVKAGSDDEDPDATGMAHYLEHVMFKGTDKIGTTDWPKESVYLDSIRLKYDELGKAKEDDKRLAIQKKINDLSIEAAKYAIPNELDKLLKFFGGTGVNAYTNYDRTVYHNSFSSSQLESWLDIYAERFRKPVFRLFQSELETVYEEKNRREDWAENRFWETIYKKMMEGHPAGHHSVIGLTEHLKNPNQTKMYEFYDKFYVAKNMALILSGDFDSKTAQKWIEAKFSGLKTGSKAQAINAKMTPIVGRNLVQVSLTPVKTGVLGFRGVPSTDPDFSALELANQILANSASTGILDKLRMDNKIKEVSADNMQLGEIGSIILYFQPKIEGQTNEEAEKLILSEVEKLKNGDFPDDLLASLKIEQELNFKRKNEAIDFRAGTLTDNFIKGTKWEDEVKRNEEIKLITKEDIKRVAKKYFGKDYIAFLSEQGEAVKEKLQKPPYKPVIPMNNEVESEFAKLLKAKPSKDDEPKFIEIGKDITVSDIKDRVHLYYTPNPFNDVFTLRLSYGQGSRNDLILKKVGLYLDLIGTQSKDFQQFRKELQQLGSTFSVWSTDETFQFYISGLDRNLAATLKLINELFTQPKNDPSQLGKFVEKAIEDNQREDQDPGLLGYALLQYGMYGDKSPYIDRLGLEETKKLTGDQLLESFKKAIQYEVNIHYVGTLSIDQVKSQIKSNLYLAEKPIKTTALDFKPRKEYKEPTLFLLSDEKALQSQIYLMKEGSVIDPKTWPAGRAFNQYFGSGMTSLMFQEIREFRSLAYSCYGFYNNNLAIKDKPGYTRCFIGTQADKTPEALETLTQMLDDMPQKVDRIDMIRKGLMQSINSEAPEFRYRSYSIQDYFDAGYQYDYRKDLYESYKKISFKDINDFYLKNVKGKQSLITVVGDKTKIDMAKLAKFGKIIEVKKEDILKK